MGRVATTLPPALSARFWSRVERGAPEECWPWLGAKQKGYGRFGWSRFYMRAHRAAFSLAHPGILSSGDVVCHRCDNPSCCNPDHLWVGTPADNIADKIEKGRQPRGETHGSAKVTIHQAKRILLDTRSHREVAGELGVSISTVYRIRTGRNWKFLSAEMREAA